MAARHLFLLFSHKLTSEQKEELSTRWGIVHFRSLPDELQLLWSNVPPEMETLAAHIQPILQWLEQSSRPGDVVLVQGDFGATYLAVQFCFEHGLVPVYATTKRVYEETRGADGATLVQKIFQHVQFRRYGE